MRKRLFCLLFLAFVYCLLSLSTRAQVPVWGTPLTIVGGTPATSAVVGSNIVTLPMKQITLTLTATNAAAFSGYMLISLDGVNWITNGYFTNSPLTTNTGAGLPYPTVVASTNITAYYTNVPVFVELKGVVSPAFSTNALGAQAVYGP